MTVRNLFNVYPETKQKVVIVEKKVIQPRSLIFEFIRVLLVLAIVTAITWGITQAQTDEGQSVSEPAPEQTETPQEEAPEDESALEEQAPAEQPPEEPATETPSNTAIPSDIPTDSETPPPTDSIDTPTDTTGESSDSSFGTFDNTSDQELTSEEEPEGIFGNILNTITDIGSGITGIVSDTLNTVSDLLTPIEQEEQTSSSTAPILFAEQETETGKLVTISSPEEDPNNPHTNVLASTTIPELYKVGEESKIQIKWKNEGGIEMPFNVYDIDENGYLDYIEWTIPHLSTQIFEIIFISKAFHLDTDQSIIADIYDTVKEQDGNYVSLTDGQYIRATFEQILDNSKDITVYARATNLESPASLEVFPLYEDENGNLTEGPLVAVFPSITEEGTYKILLTELQTPTDRFDLKVSGNIDIDLVIDPPVGWTGTGTINDPYLVNSCGTADASGYYELSSNLTSSSGNCITISANNVTLSGTSTYSITNTSEGFSDTGIYIANFTGITIRDITITTNSRAISNGGTIDEIDAIVVNNGVTRAIHNSGIISSLNGSITNNSSGHGIRNLGTISSIGATINNTAEGYGIYNLNTISEITASSTITNSGSGYGIYNSSDIGDISGTIINSGAGYGIENGASITINSIFTIDNTGGGIGFINYGTVDGSGTIIGDMTLWNGAILDLSAGLTLMGELTNNGGTVIEFAIDCSTLGKVDTYNILTDGTNYYGMCDIPLTETVDRCGVINTTGTYTLTTDLEHSYGACISINADNVTLDGDGYEIDSTGTSFNADFAIRTDAATTTIQNITVNASNGASGIRTASDFTNFFYDVDINNTGSGQGIRSFSSVGYFSGTINNSGSGHGFYNIGGGLVGEIDATVTNSSSGSGIYVGTGSLVDLNVTITNTGSGQGICNLATISEITASSTITNSGSGHGIYNEGTITTIDANIINTSTSTTASGILNLNSSLITTISGPIINSGNGYGINNSTSSAITTISGDVTNSGAGSGIYNNNNSTIADISGSVINTANGKGIYGYLSTITDISGLVINTGASGFGIQTSSAGAIEDVSGNVVGLKNYGIFVGIGAPVNNFSGKLYTYSNSYISSRLGNATISGDIISLPIAEGKIWTNTDGDHDWNNPNNWLLGVPADTSSSTDAIILASDMILPSDIDNPIYFASDGVTLYGDGYTVNNSIYGVDGYAEFGINDAKKGYDINLVDVEWAGDITAGIGGSGSSNASANGGNISIDVSDLDLVSKTLNGGVSGTGGSANGTNGDISLTYQSLSTASTTYVYDAGTFIINGSTYEGINTSDSCTNGIGVGDPGCAWHGEFNPLIFYFTNSVNTNWNTLGNWWNDSGYTVAASTLPFGYSQVIINGQISTSTSAVADTIVFNGTSTNSADITVSRNATFNASSTNAGTITITNGTSTFYGDGTDTTLGSIVGGFIQRIFTSSATTSRDFTDEGGRSDWFIKAIGNIVVDVFEATYNLASNSFQALLGAVFQSERGELSNSAGHPTPVITFDLGATNNDGDIIKWDPTIDWDTATTTGCIYSYDNFASTSTLDCSLGGTDLPRPTGGSHTLYLRGIDEYGNITETAGYEFEYNNTYPVWTMCGDDLLDENRSYYYLTEDVTEDCTITASQATTILKGNLVATSTGYTVGGNIVGNGNNINLQNITVAGTVDSDGGNVILSSATIDDEITSNGGDITISNSIIYATSTSQGGNFTLTNSTTTDIVSTATSSGTTAGSVTIYTSVIGSITANGVSGTNGGNGGSITIATSTTGTITSNGANGTTNGGNGGDITITNSYATPVGSGIFSNGGSSTSCGNGGDAGVVILTSSTYGTISTTGGNADETGCPGSGKTSGSTRTPTVQGTYTPPSSGGNMGGDTGGGNTGGGSSTGGTLRNLIKNIVKPLDFAPFTPFTPFTPNFNPTTIGKTIIPDPFQNFQPPGLINLIKLPVNFLTNISKFLFAPLPNNFKEALSSSPQLGAYLASVGVSKEQDMAMLQANPVPLDAPLSDETTPPGLFIIRSGQTTLTSYATYDASLGGLVQLVKTAPTQSLTISLIPQSEGQVTALYLGQSITFTKGSLFASAQIQTPPQGGRYILKSTSSPIPLLIEVIAPIQPEQPAKKPWGIFHFLWKLFNR